MKVITLKYVKELNQLSGKQNIKDAKLTPVKAKSLWQGNLKSSVYVKDFRPFHTDEPEEAGGENTAPNPMEYVMGALCGCSTVMIVTIGRSMDFQIGHIEIEAEGVIDERGMEGVDNVSPHFQKIEENIYLDTEEPDRRMEELKSKVENRCPAMNMLKDAGIPLNVQWKRIN